jgi:hypothetical protein
MEKAYSSPPKTLMSPREFETYKKNESKFYENFHRYRTAKPTKEQIEERLEKDHQLTL